MDKGIAIASLLVVILIFSMGFFQAITGMFTYYYDMILEYPSSIDVKRGHSYIAYIKVNNTGISALENLTVLVDAGNLSYTVNPDMISKVSFREFAFFLLTINVSEDIEKGTYFVDFNVTPDVLMKRTGRIEVNVRELTIKEDVNKTITNYQFLITKTRQMAQNVSRRGGDTSAALLNLEFANNSVLEAIMFYESGNYSEAETVLGVARTYIETSVIELAVATIPSSRDMLPWYTPLLMLGIILAGIIVYLRYLGKKE